MMHFLTGFDTRIDTKKIFVTIKYKFVLRDYLNSTGKSPLYIHISSPGSRERMKTELEFKPVEWCQKTQRLKKEVLNAQEHNLILDNLISKITKIKTTYLLSEATLTAKKLAEELRNTTNRVDFIVFFTTQLALEKKSMAKGYYKRVGTVLNKLKEYRSELSFSDINEGFEKNYRNHLANLGNKKTTINSNMATIKKFLMAAEKYGVKTPMKGADIKIGKTTGNRIDLSPTELQRFYNYYFSEFIPKHWKLVLGYFLFSCFTSLRWSNVNDLSRSDIVVNDYVNFYVPKTGKRQSIVINDKARRITEHCPDLFTDKISPEFANRELKVIANHLNQRKKITFHVARHTFATNFIRMGGDVVKLRIILGHSNIRETMIYVHIVEQEANESMHLMDKLFE
jgi:site-specific recombinase XerD